MTNRKNLANGLLASSVGPSATVFPLRSGEGAFMPPTPFKITVTEYGSLSQPSNSEICNVTAVAGNNLTVQRAQLGTTAKSFTTNAVVSAGIYVEESVASVAGKVGDVTLVKADVGLGNVDNTSDANKPISTATQTALDGKEALANKSTNTALGSSNTLYPTQNAVKTYVDNNSGGTPGGADGSVQYNDAGTFAGFGEYDIGNNNFKFDGGLGLGAHGAAIFDSWANAAAVFGKTAAGSPNAGVIGAVALGASDGTNGGYGHWGVGKTKGTRVGVGVWGRGQVDASADTGNAVGGDFDASDTHAGGANIGVRANATGGSSNYSIHSSNGDMYHAGPAQFGGEVAVGTPTASASATTKTYVDTALSGKVTGNGAITGSTKTKVTYDAKGLVTAGADATTADINDSANKRYVTDANLTTINNTSGTNTGDNATNSQYSGLAASKQDTLVSGTNIKTVNSNSLLGSGNITISGGSGGAVTAVTTTGMSTVDKVATTAGGSFSLTDGALVLVQYNNGNNAGYQTMNIDGTGAKGVKINNNNASTDTILLNNNASLLMTYRASNDVWVVAGSAMNNQYVEVGLATIDAGTGTDGYTFSGRRIKYAIDKARVAMVDNISSNSSITPAGVTSDWSLPASKMVSIRGLAANTTINNPSGSPIDGQRLTFRIQDNGSARTLSWGSTYRGIDGALPTTTVAGKIMYLEMIYLNDGAKWDMVSMKVQP